MEDARHLQDLREGRALDGVQVEVQVVRPVDVVAARVPLVQVDAAEVHHPQERGEVLDHRELDDVARGVLDGARLDPRRARVRRALHEEERALGAIRITLHHHRAVLDVGQQRRGDMGVILQEVALRHVQARPEDLPEIRQLDLPAVDLDDGIVAVARDADRRHRRGGLPSPPWRRGGGMTIARRARLLPLRDARRPAWHQRRPVGAAGRPCARRRGPGHRSARDRRPRIAGAGRPGSCRRVPRSRAERRVARRRRRRGCPRTWPRRCFRAGRPRPRPGRARRERPRWPRAAAGSGDCARRCRRAPRVAGRSP